MPDITDMFENLEIERVLSARNVKPASYHSMINFKDDAIRSLTRFDKIHGFTSCVHPATAFIVFIFSFFCFLGALNSWSENPSVLFGFAWGSLALFILNLSCILFEELIYSKAYEEALENNLKDALNESFGEMPVKDFLSFQYVMQKVDPVESSYPNSSKFYELYLTGEKHETFSALSENFDGSLKELYETVEILAASN